MTMGHGWVNPLPGGARARCGGPPLCRECAEELAAAKNANWRMHGLSAFSDEEIAREHHWRMLNKLGDPRVAVSMNPKTEGI